MYPHIEVKLLADSVCEYSTCRITTFALTYPRFIHAEFMTHRMFSRNAQSSRAIPTSRRIAKVRDNPVMPIRWGRNIPGMVASSVDVNDPAMCEKLWRTAARNAADVAEMLNGQGLHKQWANRILEPFDTITTIVTSTTWTNFFDLRITDEAQPEMRELAASIRFQRDSHTPEVLTPGRWHLPYIQPTEQFSNPSEARMVSAARCARVSYLGHDGTVRTVQEELDLAKRLADSKHLTPFEHQAKAAEDSGMYANFKGWISNRFHLEAAGRLM